jgi:hypothetical protein
MDVINTNSVHKTNTTQINKGSKHFPHLESQHMRPNIYMYTLFTANIIKIRILSE